MDLRVDVLAERVQIGPRTLLGQWVDFYAVLALACAEEDGAPTFVSAATVARVGPWRYKSVASVGKEVARHLNRLTALGLGHLLDHRGRTRAWRLALPSRSLHFRPSRAVVAAWVRTRCMNVASPGGSVQDLYALVEATAALRRGDAESALTHVTTLSSRAGLNPALDAWSALVEGRAASQHDDEDDELLAGLCDRWLSHPDATGRAVGVRLRALLAMRYRFQDPCATLASLTKLAAELELRGDLGSLGVLLNAMGVLARRSGDPEAGVAHHLRAAALFGIGGDYPSLQAALFNLALCKREVLAKEARPPDEEVLQLIELCRTVCAEFRVGGDSGQAEIVGAGWCLEMGDIARARKYLAAADALVQKVESTFDQACFLRVRAQIELAEPSGSTDPLRDLRTAAALFTKVGDAASAAQVRKLLAKHRPK